LDCLTILNAAMAERFKLKDTAEIYALRRVHCKIFVRRPLMLKLKKYFTDKSHRLITKGLTPINNAEGGTRTRTAFWARGFSYHYSFRYLPLISS
jgi:hypothetical protein